MQDSEQTPTPDRNSTAEEFARELRSKAQQAAEASLHHASLSQQYLELSQKFDQLAERANAASLSELQQSLQELEQRTPAVSQSAGNDDSRKSLVPEIPELPSATERDSAFRTPPENPFADDGKNTQQSASASGPDVTTSGRRSRKRKANTRRLVERLRAAKPAAQRRVRVKAKKGDLKPKQRTATEELRKGGSSIATSLLVLAATVFTLSLVSWQLEIETPLNPIICSFASEVKPVEEPQPIEPPEEEPGEQTEEKADDPIEEPVEPEPEEMAEQPETPEPVEPETAEMPTEAPLPEMPNSTEPATDSQSADAVAVDNRSEDGKQALLQKYGGSEASESAVQRGLEWLVSVQHPQGYWDFIHVGPSGNAGTINNPIGGTAYALLPFLAAGQTHKEGDYQKQVGAGLTYLTRVGVTVPAGYDLRGMINKQSDDKEPNEAYYVHGAATLALCEAFSMTNDRRLKRAAEGAVQFIINSQDPKGGGWRYNPREPGSTSVTAIQVMALMAAKKAGIKVPESTLKGVMHYLDSVQVDGEGRYGYEIEKKKYTGAITSMALLCRMYLGWGRDDGDLQAGIGLLDKAGPYDNLYSLYFATQVMKNWGGEEWVRWNERLRDDLVAIQETDGPAAGSWKPRTGAIHAKQGGRLLTTALATLTLEVYYRYKPLLPEANSNSTKP